jgi:hypothetical protein
MSKFTGTSDDKHDDIVSAISLLVEQYASYADFDSRINSVHQDYAVNMKSKAMHDMVYCLGKYARLNEAGIIDENPTTQYQVDKALASAEVQQAYYDPIQEAFG